MKAKKVVLVLVMVLMLGMVSVGNATVTLVGTDEYEGRLIYDSESGENGVTWYEILPEASFWSDADDWTNSLVVVLGGATYNEWSLPTIAQFQSVYGQLPKSDGNPGWISEDDPYSAFLVRDWIFAFLFLHHEKSLAGHAIFAS